MRIITGIYKGRHFDIPRSFKARPTTDFAKENIFNVIGGYSSTSSADTSTLTVPTLSTSLQARAAYRSRCCRAVARR